MGQLDEATIEIIRLRCQLVELRQQTPETNAGATAGATVANYRLRGIGPKHALTGTDTSAYAPWEHGVKKELRVVAVMYSTRWSKFNTRLHRWCNLFFNRLARGSLLVRIVLP